MLCEVNQMAPVKTDCPSIPYALALTLLVA